jgi:hypothetical protein
VKLHTNPHRLWRYLRQSLADDLLYHSGRDGMTQLQRIVLRRLAEIRGADADLGLWWDWLKDQHPDPEDLTEVLESLLDRLDTLELRQTGAGNAVNRFTCRIGDQMQMEPLGGRALPLGLIVQLATGLVADEFWTTLAFRRIRETLPVAGKSALDLSHPGKRRRGPVNCRSVSLRLPSRPPYSRNPRLGPIMPAAAPRNTLIHKRSVRAQGVEDSRGIGVIPGIPSDTSTSIFFKKSMLGKKAKGKVRVHG